MMQPGKLATGCLRAIGSEAAWLDWADLPEPFDWKNDQPDPQLDVTVAFSLQA